MNRRLDVCFVGQGPNRRCWERGLLFGRDYSAQTKTPTTAEAIAESYAARVAITGAVGRALAKLAGVEPLRFFACVRRENLNRRWNGKEGRGDVFLRDEARIRAAALLADPSIRQFVLLGDGVARAFNYRLDVRTDPDVRLDRLSGRTFLVLPHPSGINLWWNDEFHVLRARRALRAFLNLEPA